MGDLSLDSAQYTSNMIPEGTASPKRPNCCERHKSIERKTGISVSSLPVYGLILLLFVWNAELWSQVKELRSELLVLKLKLEDSPTEYKLSAKPLTQVQHKEIKRGDLHIFVPQKKSASKCNKKLNMKVDIWINNITSLTQDNSRH